MTRITGIETIRTRADGTWLFVKVLTDQPGLYGIGSASDHYRARVVQTAVETVAPLIIGRDASRIEDIWQSIYTCGYWRNDAVMNTVQAGIDMALWDIKGKEAGMKPLSCVVVDAGGHVIAFQRQDGTSFLRLDIARGKAAGALALGVNSRRLEEMAKERPHFIGALAHLTPGGLAPVAGGVIVKGPDGLPIGAVGVTGDTSDNDEVAALAGIAAAGLTAL